MSTNPFDAVSRRVSDFLGQRGLQNLENPVTQLIRQSLQDMEFVTLEEFEIQKAVIDRLRQK
uniref:accessory factor UbiK family protein n=2 Tax=Pseudomonadota TaxID=1224 RepID=UPI00254B5B44